MGSQLCSRFPDGSDAVQRASQEISGKSDQASIPCTPPLAANRHQRPVPRDYALRFREQGARRGKYSMYSITRKCLCAGGMLHAQAPANPIPTMMAQPAYRHPSPEARGREPPPAWSQVRLSLGVAVLRFGASQASMPTPAGTTRRSIEIEAAENLMLCIDDFLECY